MKSELIIQARERDISIALLEDKTLVEYQNVSRGASFTVGNIYLARVKKIMPGLNAAFVDVGYERDAFIHYLDLGRNYNSYDKYLRQLTSDRRKQYPYEKAQTLPQLPKDGAIADTLKPGDDILVQIVKEPISTKGPRLTAELSIAGRFIVLLPFASKVNISAKIRSQEERARLRQTVQGIKPKGCGVIVRTVAENLRAEDIVAEMKELTERWRTILTRAQRAPRRPALVYEEQSRAIALLRDHFNPTYEGVYVDDEAVFREVQQYVAAIAPDRAAIVKRYTGAVPIFDAHNVTRQIKSSFGTTVNYRRGAYLVIEHTEAMHVVDVNSGNRTRSDESQEANALDVNLGAADELARQLRLRDMGGIIIVDFIDMNRPEDRQALYERMVDNMARDRARHNILPLSKFGLMQITRQRVRPAMDVAVRETCPTCLGKGTIRPSLLFTDTLERKLARLVNETKQRRFTLFVHPYVHAYLTRGLLSLNIRWHMRYGIRWQLRPAQELQYLQYRFVATDGTEIDMTETNDKK